jgi:hypothetical protein
VLKSAVPDPLDRFRALGIDPSRVLHGEQAFVYCLPLRVGMTYTVRTRIADVYERKSGSLVFIVEETALHGADDAVVLTMRSTIVVRVLSPVSGALDGGQGAEIPGVRQVSARPINRANAIHDTGETRRDGPIEKIG